MKDPRVAHATTLALLLATLGSVRAQSKDLGDLTAPLREGRYEQALELVEARLATRPRNADLLHIRALCKGKLGHHEAAIADATAAIEVDPKHAGAFGERGYNLFHVGQLERALADYDKSIELEPGNAMVCGERGDVLLELGRWRAAMDAYDAAIRLAPAWPNPHSQRGRAALRLADFEAARASFGRAVTLVPDDLFSLFHLAGAQFDCGLDDEALKTCRRLCRKTNDQGDALLLARLAWQVDRHDRAREQFDQVLARGDADQRVDARLSLGSMLLGLGKPEEALAAMVLADGDAKQHSLGPWLALMRWCARWSLGQRDEAEQLLSRELDACASVDDDVRTLAAQLAGEQPGSGFGSANPERAFENCPALFFAGWRALADGDEERGDALLLQCIATGATVYTQWHVARTVLLRRHGPGAFAVETGATFVPRDIEGRKLLVVASVAAEPPGAARWQGLQEGDVLLRVADVAYDPDTFVATCASRRVGHDVHLTVLREGEEKVVMLRLGWRRL